jgi:pyruvate formate lyase activating enzyme
MVGRSAGYIFNIQQFSVHDGPGIRTIVFLKGCPLRCQWCSNPESQQGQPELALNVNKCIGISQCGHCIKACPNQVISVGDNDQPHINRAACKKCFHCAKICPTAACSVFGKIMSVDEILKVVDQDEAFYARSGGGLTLSGGEPLLQADFAWEILKEAKRRRINTAIETSGYAAWSELAKLCPSLNSIIYDIKCISSAKHQQRTQQSNEVILENFKKLATHFPELPIVVRTPIIPGFNDTLQDITAILDFITGRPNLHYEMLPYHRLGQAKYAYLGKEYSLTNITLADEKIKQLQEVVQQYF